MNLVAFGLVSPVGDISITRVPRRIGSKQSGLKGSSHGRALLGDLGAVQT
jgi:hypothetical protein